MSDFPACRPHRLKCYLKPDIGITQKSYCEVAGCQDQTSSSLSIHYSFHYSKILYINSRDVQRNTVANNVDSVKFKGTMTK